MAGLDFKNPVEVETFDCFKKVCIIKRNTNEYSRLDPVSKDSQVAVTKKVSKSTYRVQQQELDSSGDEFKPTVHAALAPTQKPWKPPSGLKFSCPMGNHKHKVSPCAEFFALSPLELRVKIDKGRLCFSCFKPKNTCRSRRCANESTMPEVLKWDICAS